ncbi:MAG: alpha-galactosidase [Clostridium sp.]|nr:alpha-galactosidase [Clostridium sp.]MDU7084240.1 alpha-galactosidase [Clostridium sp.]
MGAIYNSDTREFHLFNKNVSYIFNIMRNNQLGHLYFGKRIKHRDSYGHLFNIRVRGDASYIFEEDPRYNLDNIAQEYPAYGTSDYREPAIYILQEDGSRIVDFQYKSHKIYEGKPRLKGLPATYVEEDEECTTVEVTLVDEVINSELTLIYSIYEEYDVVIRSSRITNKGKSKLNIQRFMSTCIDFQEGEFEMLQFSGAWARERQLKCRKIEQGIQAISSTRGSSSATHNPFMVLKRKDTTEHSGETYGFSLVYSGNFLGQVECNFDDCARVTMGINPFDFNWILEEDEQFQSPEVVMAYSNDGLNAMSQIYHKLYRTRLVRGIWREKPRPILINNWEATYFDFNEEKILNIAEASSKLGIELFVLDDGWFGKRNDDRSSLGDWFVNEEKLPSGIKGLAEKIEALGMKFGLWFEPEMISKNSKLYEAHPDWLLQVPNRKNSIGRHQHTLDFSRKEVVDKIYEMMSKILRESPVSYVKWDMNRSMTEIGSAMLPPERQGEVAHRYILGVYDLYERLTSEFPHILFESCAGGGARFDPGLLYYAPQTWTSDNTDAIERLKIQYSTSMVYPLSAIGSHVSASPNHQVGRETSIETRSNVAYFGTFGYELDVNKLSEEEKKKVKGQVEFFKNHRDLIQKGDFYRILSPYDGNMTSWIVVSSDQEEALLGLYQVLAGVNLGFFRLKLKGLNEEYEYVVEGREETYFGDELMNVGLVFNKQYIDEAKRRLRGDFSSELIKIKRK